MTALPQEEPRPKRSRPGRERRAPGQPPASPFREPGALTPRPNSVALPDGWRATLEPPVNSDGFLGGDFTMDSQEFLRWLAVYFRDDTVTLRLTIYLMGSAVPGGRIKKTQRALATELDLHQSQVSRSLAILAPLGIVTRLKGGLYQFQPKVSLRGGTIPIEAKPGTRAQGRLKVDQLSLLTAMADDPTLPDEFRYLTSLPKPEARDRKESSSASCEAGPEPDLPGTDLASMVLEAAKEAARHSGDVQADQTGPEV